MALGNMYEYGRVSHKIILLQVATTLRLVALCISISVFFPWMDPKRRGHMRIFFLHWARCEKKYYFQDVKNLGLLLQSLFFQNFIEVGYIFPKIFPLLRIEIINFFYHFFSLKFKENVLGFKSCPKLHKLKNIFHEISLISCSSPQICKCVFLSGVMYVLSQFILSVMVLNCWTSKREAGPVIFLIKFWELAVLNLWSISSLAIAVLIAIIVQVRGKYKREGAKLKGVRRKTQRGKGGKLEGEGRKIRGGKGEN